MRNPDISSNFYIVFMSLWADLNLFKFSGVEISSYKLREEESILSFPMKFAIKATLPHVYLG